MGMNVMVIKYHVFVCWCDSLLPDGRGSKGAVQVDLLLNWAVSDNSLGCCFVFRGLHGHHANTV